MENVEIDERTDEELELERTEEALKDVNEVIDGAKKEFKEKKFTIKEYLELIEKRRELQRERDKSIVKEVKVTWVESDFQTES